MHMRRGTLRLSASDLMGFNSCRHATTRDLRQLEDRNLEPTIKGEEAKLLRLEGDKHELAYLAGLRQAGHSVIEIPKGASPRAFRRVHARGAGRGPDVLF